MKTALAAASLACLAGAALSAAPATAQAKSNADYRTHTIHTFSGPVRVTTLTRGLEYPWAMEAMPNGGLLITEKPGKLRMYSEEDGLSDEISGLPELTYRGQGGLHDVALHPDFEENSRIYLYFVEAADEQPDDLEVDADPRLGPYVDETDTVLKGGAVYAATLDLDAMTLEDGSVIWQQTPKTVGLGHYGGRLAFGPDGKLYIASGERQKFDPADDMSSNLGKVVRLNDDGSVPDDNPFASRGGTQAATFSSGHRNPLGLAFDDEGQLWINEMGPLEGDELNLVEAGKSYGWPDLSNGEHYNHVGIPHHETDRDAAEQPVFYWYPAISPSGLAIYDGDMFEDWQGHFLNGGLSAQGISRVALNDEGEPEAHERIKLDRRVRDVAVASDGAVLVLTDEEDGALLRLAPAS